MSLQVPGGDYVYLNMALGSQDTARNDVLLARMEAAAESSSESGVSKFVEVLFATPTSSPRISHIYAPVCQCRP